MSEGFPAAVVYYHSVGPVLPHWHRSFLTVSENRFRQHLEYFRKNFTIISLKELWHIRSGSLAPVRRPLVITFDDGYSDNYSSAFPILKEYGLKATIFVSPGLADSRDIARGTGDPPGFLSWREMKIMEESGLVDIQSHTMTHTRHFISDKITGFHHPGGDILYPVLNSSMKNRVLTLNDPDFERLIPYGFPLFEENSSVLSRRVTISSEFISKCIERLKDYNFSRYEFSEAFNRVKDLYDDFRKSDRIIESRETDSEYLERIHFEIAGSREIIEERLGKRVEFLCWPHGDNNQFLHRYALDCGYLMTSAGKAEGVNPFDPGRIPERMGVDFSSFRRRLKTVFKLKAFSGIFPYSGLYSVLRKKRHG